MPPVVPIWYHSVMLLEEPRPSFPGREAEPFPFDVGSADGCQLGPHPFPARVIARPVA